MTDCKTPILIPMIRRDSSTPRNIWYMGVPKPDIASRKELDDEDADTRIKNMKELFGLDDD